MKKKFVVGQLLTFRLPVYLTLFTLLISCEPDNNRLGINLFPPSDTILVYTDTLYNIEAHLVSSRPVFSSVNTSAPSTDKLFLLGALNDTITGVSKAEIVTQVAFSNIGKFGANPKRVDSLTLWLYCSDVVGDTTKEVRLMVHEFTDRIYYNQVYFSNFDVTGKYNPVPLVDEMIVPKSNTFYEFKITDQDYLARIHQAIVDSAFSSVDSIRNTFFGFYITTEQQPDSHTMAKIGLANPISRLGFQYVHDSIPEDSITAESWHWYFMNFHEYFTQKVNIFHHDYTGTALEQLIDNPNAKSPVLYVQGMAGVNVELSIPEFDNYLDSGAISINSARLILEVLPDSMSGIVEKDYPGNLMLTNASTDTTRTVIYDYLTNTATSNFGKLIRSNSVSAFMNPLYLYRFNLGLHFQSIITGDIENTPLILYVKDPTTTTKYIKLWSNVPDQKGSLRLEIVYTKF